MCALVALACTATIGQAAYVIDVSPDPLVSDLPLVAWGNETGGPQIYQELADDWGIVIGEVDEIYKANVASPVEEVGSFAMSYETEFVPASDPSAATITWVEGTNWVTDPWYLLVKDGKQEPAWYLFDLSEWYGQDTLSLTGFWTGNGAISHVTIYGSPGTPIPEPASLAVWSALGVIFGIGLYRRRRGQR